MEKCVQHCLNNKKKIVELKKKLKTFNDISTIFFYFFFYYFIVLVCFRMHYNIRRVLGFPGGSEGKMSACNADLSSIPGLGRSHGKRNGNPF